MRKISFIFLLFTLFILIWYGESRKFYCLGNGKCITVWKTYNNVCYIIPGKYYGIIKPSKNFIQSTNTNNLSVFFTNELPRAFIYQSEEDLIINNRNKDETIFYDYNSDSKKFNKILYPLDAKKSSDLKDKAQLIYVFIHENYALDKDGKKL